MKDAEPGSIVKIARHDGLKFALVTDHVVNDARSFVWLNPGFRDKPQAIFAEDWRMEASVLSYGQNIRFELGLTDDTIDASGRNVWEVAGAIVLIDRELFIRAAPQDPFYGSYRLVNVRNGAVYPNNPPTSLWTFLSWQLWIRDPNSRCDLMLTEFHAANSP